MFHINVHAVVPNLTQLLGVTRTQHCSAAATGAANVSWNKRPLGVWLIRFDHRCPSFMVIGAVV